MSLRRQTLWSMLPILLTSVISIVSVPIYFRVLGAEMYALWFYVGTLTGAFGFMDLGIGVAVGRYMGVAMGASDDQAVREYWSTGHVIALPFLIFFAVIFGILGTIWGPLWFNVPAEQASILRWAMLFGGISLFLNYYGQMWNILAQAHLDFKYLSLLRSVFSLASTGGALAVALIVPNVAVIVAFTTLLAAIQFFLLLHRGSYQYKLPVTLSESRKSRFIEMLPYTLKTFGQLIASSVLGSLDRLFLGRVAPAVDFAAFNVAMNIGGRISGLSVAIMGPVFHNTTRGIGGDIARNPNSIYRESFELMFPWYSLVIIGAFFGQSQSLRSGSAVNMGLQ
ncbi:MAG: oligosaccharide flippase family protein [Blastochloris sp.]|nr:oligosaccharide flippase family protein [Blastochloris sp.]